MDGLFLSEMFSSPAKKQNLTSMAVHPPVLVYVVAWLLQELQELDVSVVVEVHLWVVVDVCFQQEVVSVEVELWGLEPANYFGL